MIDLDFTILLCLPVLFAACYNTPMDAETPVSPTEPQTDPLLENLNPSQRAAVLHAQGPLLILAGAGSGKTRVLTHRIAYLIGRRGVRPRNILAVTFTNKAANEMRERLSALLGAPATKEMWVGTFHAICARMLRERGQAIGLERDFVVYDDGDQVTLIKECLHQLNLDDRQYPPRSVLSFISRAKEKLISADDFGKQFKGVFENVVGKIYPLYQEKLKLNRALDFDDLIYFAVRLLEQREDIRAYYQGKFRYVLVDEYQDVNHSQFRLTQLLSDGNRNICVVGDEDQCLPPQTPIQTATGTTPISELSEGDAVAGSGGGNPTFSAVAHVHQRHYDGELFAVRGEGFELRATPQHLVFARLSLDSSLFYIYLMYRADKGYRIGITKALRRGFKAGAPQDQVGLIIRCIQEHADKMWILKSAATFGEARFWECFLSAKYGLPTMVFHSVGREGIMGGQEWIDHLYDELDTEAAAERLMRDLHINPAFPHHRPQGGKRRQSVLFSMFGGYRTSRTMRAGEHRITWCARNEPMAALLKAEGFPVRPSKLSGFKIETARSDYAAGVALAKEIANAGCMEVFNRARINKETYLILPISHVQPGMRVLTEREGELIESEVTEVTREEYSGPVYDLEVERLHTYIAGGMLVHNSIYGWRGADVSIILGFEDTYPDATVIKLEQNYRSTQNILDAAYQVVSRNRGRKDKKLWTENPPGSELVTYEALNEQEEGVYLAGCIREGVESGKRRFSDYAVLYRTNAQSRVLEEVLINYRIPYKIVGGVRFYERREIKDLLAYLRLVHNPYDSVALRRVVNVPARGVGAGTWQKIENAVTLKNLGLWDVLTDTAELGLKGTGKKGIEQFVALIAYLHGKRKDLSVTQITEEVIERTGYVRELEQERTVDAQNRIENIRELLSVTRQFEESTPNPEDATLSNFLEVTALMADIDSLEDTGADFVVLMTLHSAKGLEFPVVFMTGLEEGIFPHSRSMQSDREMEEERRLAYVGITRAREELYLTFANRRTIFGNTQMTQVSRFLRDIPKELLNSPHGKSSGAIGGGARVLGRWSRDEYSQINSWDEAQEGTRAAEKARGPVAPSSATTGTVFKIGEKVKHAVFGNGTVLSCVGEGDEAQVTVAFPNVGVKKLVAGYARLEKVG
ncbi:MAG: hypothetical protein OHK0029_36190 [Armatimonadaceae bacterium]